ncbi:hypothetical protein F4774DRAFT_423187 [Daldinia eschscholtzii]|nr:hypothetical protein F4774DRAFT_423187 [Daldinia eschscholtzii]
MANKKSSGNKKGTHENPIDLDDNTTIKASSRRAQGRGNSGAASTPKSSRSQKKQDASTKKKAKKSTPSRFRPSRDDSDSDIGPAREPWEFGPTDEEFFSPSAKQSYDGNYGAYMLRMKLRNGDTDKTEERGYRSSDPEILAAAQDSYSEEEPQPKKKRGKKQTGPLVRKRQKHSPEPKISSSKAMDHLTARVVDKSRRDDFSD